LETQSPGALGEPTERTPLRPELFDWLKEANDDILALAGVKLPAIFQTTLRRWLMLMLFSIVNSVASGPMTMFPALEPIFIQEKVFEGPSQMGQLSTVYSITMGVIMSSMLPIGIIYDSYGPRWVAVVGTILFAVCSTGIGISLRIQSLNWMLYFFYPVGLMFGYGKSFGAYGYQWLLPDSQNTVNSVIAATQALSDMLVLVCVWLYDDYGVQLWTYFWWLAVLSVLTAILNNVIVPSRREHIEYAVAVISFKAASDPGYGSEGSHDFEQAVDDGPAIKTSGWRWWDNAKGTCKTFQNYPVEHILFISGCCGMYMFSWYPTMQMYPFYVGMFGAAEATTLVDEFAVIYGILGSLGTLFAGRVLDWIGLKKALFATSILNMVALAALWTPTVPSQLFFQVFLTLSLSMFQIFVQRFCMVYAPVQLFGTYSGVIMLIMGLFQMVCSAVASLVKSHVANLSVADQDYLEVVFVRTLSTAFCALTLALFAMLIVYWQWFPPPHVGTVSCRKAGIPEESEYKNETSMTDGDGSMF